MQIGINYSKIVNDFGIIKWSNKSIFKGYFKNNIPNGWGIYFHHTNGTFKGQYFNDQPNGFGIYNHITDSIYEGYWKNERQDGYGIERWNNGIMVLFIWVSLVMGKKMVLENIFFLMIIYIMLYRYKKNILQENPFIYDFSLLFLNNI